MSSHPLLLIRLSDLLGRVFFSSFSSSCIVDRRRVYSLGAVHFR